MALCRKLTYGPRLQDRLWSMSFFLPQTQKRETFGIDHPYLRQILSLNSCLLRQYPRHFRGSADNHDEAPFSQFSKMIFCFINDDLSEICCNWAFSSNSLACLIAAFLTFIVSLSSLAVSCSWERISSENFEFIAVDTFWVNSKYWAGLVEFMLNVKSSV